MGGFIAEGKVRFASHQSNQPDNLLYACKNPLMALQPGDTIHSKSWTITAEQAAQLKQAIDKDKQHPPGYLLLGNRHSMQQTAEKSSSNGKRHNCFTWARERINACVHPDAKIPDGDVMGWLYTQTSRYLPATVNRHSLWYQKPIAIAAITATGTAVASYYIATNRCNIQ